MACRNIIVEPNSAAVMFIRQNIDLINLGVIKQKNPVFHDLFCITSKKALPSSCKDSDIH